MPINPDAVGSVATSQPRSWTSKDCLLYALGVGAGVDDLAFTTENSMNIDQRALPTMPVVLAEVAGAWANIGSFNPAMLVHGEQRVELLADVPVTGSVVTEAEITAIYDKEKGAVVEVTGRSSDAETGAPMFNIVMTAFIRGEGGFGGDRGPSGPRHPTPDREPDERVVADTSVDQALIYRLSGDRNPLHSDPSFAQMAGFDRPILHGLCTYGFAGRALLSVVCDGDPSVFGSMDGRFSAPVFPGERLTTEIWTDDDGAMFRTLGQDGRVVLGDGRCERR